MVALTIVLILLVDGLHKLSDHQRYTLYSLDLFLCPYQFSLETPTPGFSIRKYPARLALPLLIFYVLFLQVDISMSCKRVR